MTTSPAEPLRDRATLGDWLAVVAGTLGSLMALIDVSIVNASLPVIQGEIGATPSEGTWVGTSYLIAEIVAIPLVAWMQRLVGFRRLMLGANIAFVVFSMMCGLASSLPAIILGRIGQGLAGGVLIPSAMTIVARRLPPSQQGVGLALTAMAAITGPIGGPLLGGWLTENVSWSLIFFINAPIGLIQVIMILVAMEPEPGDRSELRGADWAGIAGMAIGLGCITTLLEEGHREHWFESSLIWTLALSAAIGFGLIAAGQAWAKRPVLKLALLRDPNLASAVGLMGVVGLLLFSSLFITPQFLAAVAGYNAIQSGQIAILGGFCGIPAAALYPTLSRHLGSRAIVAMAVGFIGFATFLAGQLTADSVGGDFVISQLLYGAGTTLSAIPLQQTVLASVTVDDAPEANSLIGVARNIGGSIGLAAIASFQEQRLEFHRWQLHSGIVANDPEVQSRLAQTAMAFGGGDRGMDAALGSIDGQVLLQSLVMTFNDMYLVMAAIAVLVLPLVLLLRPVQPGGTLGGMH